MRRSNGSLALLGFGAAVAGAAWIGSRYNPRDLRTRLWYRRLNKPSYNPPDALFPIVWAALYTLIALSGWRVWQRRDSPERTAALRLWISQLIANAQWSRLFFGERPRGLWWTCYPCKQPSSGTSSKLARSTSLPLLYSCLMRRGSHLQPF